jgi:ParB family chromosome partitioning protein
MKIEQVPIEQIVPDPNNPRKCKDPAAQEELNTSVKQHKVLVPCIGYRLTDAKVQLVEGHRRLVASLAAGYTHLPVIVLAKAPDAAELLIIQLEINCRRADLNAVDQANAYESLMKMRGWNAAQLAQHLGISQSTLTRILGVNRLGENERQLVREGKLSSSTAYALARLPEAERTDLAGKAAAGELTRDDLNARARRNKSSSGPKARRLTCVLPAGSVTVATPRGLDLASLVELLQTLLKECRRARTERLDIVTFAAVLRDRNAPTDEQKGHEHGPVAVVQ